ncbi:MAG TPA: hypothetical protein VI336_02015 [Candidatus Saccharimonadales bacterium]|nr:hypothetical protein [Candidatus Saccharimonadales bacterium]
MDYLANYGGYGSDDMTSIVVAGLGFMAIGLILGYVLGAGRVPGVKPPKKKNKK